jgi:glycosyltransferase involved in cell wall biosynthesis
MKILITSRHAAFIGGIERFLYDSSRILKDAGNLLYGFFEEDGIPSEAEGIFDRTWILSDGARNSAAMDEICDLSPDVVLIHKTRNSSLLRFLNKRFKTVAIVHDHEYYCMRNHKYFPLGRVNCHRPFNLVFCSLCSGMLSRKNGHLCLANPLEQIAVLREIRKCSFSAVLSGHMMDNLVMNGFDRNRIFKLRPPIRFSSEPVVENVRSGPLRILFVGQLIRGKGADMLLQATNLLKMDFRLKIAGRGNDESYLKSLVHELGLAGKVEFCGNLSDIASIYDWANLAVMPCRWQEPFGLVGVEAMSRSRPVVAFDVGGIREWLRDGWNGLLAKHGDIADLAAKIDSIASSTERMGEMGANALQMARNEFSNEAFVESFNVIFKETL